MANLGRAAGGAATGAAAGAALGPVGAAVGGVIGGVAGLFSGDDDEPKPPPPVVTPEASHLIDRANARGAMSEQGFAAETMKGVGANMLGAIQPNASFGGASPTADALRTRAQRLQERDLSDLSRKANIMSTDRKHEAEQAAHKLQFQKTAAQNKTKLMNMAYERDMEAARNQTIASILGGVGSVVGTAIGSKKDSSMKIGKPTVTSGGDNG